MALAATIVWEVRSSGNSANGGGFKTGASGSDFSQQDAAQYSLTGLTSAGAGAVILTASAAADMVGNILNVTAGTNFTTGRREIISVVVGVSITCDANVTTGVGAAGTAEIGGAVASPANIATAIVVGNEVWLKNGSNYVLTATATYTPGTGGNVHFEGYGTTRGDGGVATVTSATNNVTLFALASGCSYAFHYINFTHTAATRAAAISPPGTTVPRIIIEYCTFDGPSSAIAQTGASSDVTWVVNHSEIKNCTGSGVNISRQARLFMYACWIHDNGSHGIEITGNFTQNVMLLRCVVTDNTADGMFVSTSGDFGNFFLHYCVVAGNVDGFEQSGTTVREHVSVSSTIFYNNSGVGIKWNGTIAPTHPCLYRNAFGANGTDYSSNVPAGIDDVALSADPFTNAAGGDYSLNSTSGGGLDCRDTGDPVTIP